MNSMRLALLAAFSSLALATPALAAPTDGERATRSGVAPCDGDGPFDQAYDTVALHRARSYFAADVQAAPDDRDQADPDADEGDESAEEGEDGDRDEGCAHILVTPYDLLIRAPDTAPTPVTLPRRRGARKEIWA